ncbi:hypothetical protein Tco_0382623 [Tanacetum coccineum]
MTVKQLEDIHNFKQEGDKSLYQAWERYNDLLYKCPTYDINNHQKGPIPGMTPAQALITIQTMADHSQKWHDGTTSRSIGSSSSNDGLAALVNKLDNLGRDIKKLKESVHAIQVRYGEFGQRTPFNRNNGGKFRVGPPRYYTKTDNRPPYGERRQSLEELLAKHQEESARRSTKMEVWVKKLQENAEINTRNQNASLKNLETQIEQLTKEIREPVKKALLKLWLIDCFQDDSAIVNNATHRNFDDYKWEFSLEIDKLADEYVLGIGKKGHILDNIWEFCNQVHNKNYGWHNHEFENEEREEIGIEDEDYHPPEVQVETFKIKKYSFKGGQSFVCVSKDLDNVLPLGRKSGSKFKEMI